MRARALACLAVLTISVSSVDARQDTWYERHWSPTAVSKWSTENLESTAAYLRAEMIKLQGRTQWDSSWEAYQANVEAYYQNVRQALAERGIRVPGLVVAGSSTSTAAGAGNNAGTGATGSGAGGRGATTTQPIDVPRPAGSNTRPIARPDAGVPSGPSLVVPLTVVLGAAQLAECSLRGVPFAQCAVETGLKTAGGMAVGSLVVVLSASGKPIVAALATGAGIGLAGVAVGSAVITTVYAGIEGGSAASAELDAQGAEALLAQQQALNISRLTPEKLETLMQNFAREAISVTNAQRLMESAAFTPASLHQSLQAHVDEARTALAAFQLLNDAVKPASGMCADSRRNPAAAAVGAEQAAVRARVAADRAAALFGNARTLAVPCDPQRVAAARAALTAAHEQYNAAQRAETDTRDAVRDAAVFFSTVRLARDTAGKAAAQIVELERILAAAEQTALALRSAVDSYRSTRNATLRQHAQLAASVRAVHDALGPSAPADVRALLTRISALVPQVGRTLSNDELRRMTDATDVEINRISGLLRTARDTTHDIGACAQVVDAMPASIKALLDRLMAEVISDARRAAAAATSAENLPGALDACAATRAPETGAQWSGTWTTDFGTLTLTPASDVNAIRTAMSARTPLGPAIACGPGSSVLTGELTLAAYTAWYSDRPVVAPVMACATGDKLLARFSNQPLLAPADAAAGYIRAGRIEIMMSRAATSTGTAFLGHMWRWNPVTLDTAGGEVVFGGRRRLLTPFTEKHR